MNKYRVDIRNEERGTTKTRYFSILHEATIFFATYKKVDGDTLQLRLIGDKSLLASR